MANAARAYAPLAPRERQTPLRVVRSQSRSRSLSPSVVAAARLFIVVLAVFAVVACMRIGLASATVTTSVETDRINAQVEQVRSGSAHLEVAESALSNPATVKETAVKKLGMSAPLETTVIKLPADVVAYDEHGNLSLARSLAGTSAK